MKFLSSLIGILLIASALKAQVTISLDQVQVDGTSFYNCGTVEMTAGSSSKTVTCHLNLTKPSSYVAGNGDLALYRKDGNTGMATEIPTSYGNFESDWSMTSSTHYLTQVFSWFVLPSNFNQTGDKLYVVFEAQNGQKFTSCEYSVVIKPAAPLPVAFRISPHEVEVPCGSTTPVTFTAVNINNSPGSLSYNWHVGSGWSLPSGIPVSGTITSSSSSLVLVPTGTVLSDISVTPILAGTPRGTFTSDVSLKNYSSGATIIGDGSICSGNKNYTINGLLSGETVSWSTSNPFISGISATTGTQTALSLIMPGEVFLTAELTNACGQTTTKKKKVALGTPVITSPLCFTTRMPIAIGVMDEFPDPSNNPNCVLCRTNDFLADQNIIKATATGGSNLTWEWSQTSNNYSWYTYNREAHFLTYQRGIVSFKVRVTNGCGTSPWSHFQTNVRRECTLGGDDIFGLSLRQQSNVFKTFPNPASSIVYVELADHSNAPNKRAVIEAELLDFYGFVRRKINIENQQAKINVERLPKGNYVLKINIDGQVESHQIIVD